MTETETGRRGPYAKGIAKREQIIERTLEVIAREGYEGASIKELAAAVGLSQAGLLHYFDSKEELFTEILRKRDEADAARLGAVVTEAGHYSLARDGTTGSEPEPFDVVREAFLGVVGHNADVPGLVQLYSRLAVDAASPEHPAHEFFLGRGRAWRESWVSSLRDAQAAGQVTDAIEPEALARILLAVADGLQLQWLLEPDIDMAALIAGLLRVLSPGDANDSP